MKVRVIYTESFEIDVNPDEVAFLLDEHNVEPDADDATIRAAIAEYVDVAVTDREWPTYRTEMDDELIVAARKALVASKAEGQES